MGLLYAKVYSDRGIILSDVILPIYQFRWNPTA